MSTDIQIFNESSSQEHYENNFINRLESRIESQNNKQNNKNNKYVGLLDLEKMGNIFIKILNNPLNEWISHLNGAMYKSFHSTTEYYNKYSSYLHSIRTEDIQILIKLLENGMDAQEAFNELLEIMPAYYNNFFRGEILFEKIFAILLENGAILNEDAINILLDPVETPRISNNDSSRRIEFEYKVRDFKVRAWIFKWFINNSQLDMNNLYLHWNEITPNNWEYHYFYWNGTKNNEQYKLSCLEYLKYLIEMKCEV